MCWQIITSDDIALQRKQPFVRFLSEVYINVAINVQKTEVMDWYA